ncbi:GNAT family N-acetyltransferase [Bradyrhizobium sp. SZCCHNPS2010]|uniref:GNAT family N-acetyltransferase n=1 Tax=Bradyrhizobium sp. SZCCHNPS2010 TaxID=3057333 RepID=UPI002915E291|nr:GNAT family N-acetyltransferase [Bradyrhizobium sp. SZCCHNPS2010]
MMLGNIDFMSEDPRQPDVLSLLAQADAYFHELYPAESNHLIGADDLRAQDAVFLTARRDGELLGSIAFRMLAPEHAEMKRMFVRIEARGFGLGRQLLRVLEDIARDRNVRRISLETGIKQPAAIGLYRAAGYRDCPPFGDYKADPLSLFMTKRLEPNQA